MCGIDSLLSNSLYFLRKEIICVYFFKKRIFYSDNTVVKWYNLLDNTFLSQTSSLFDYYSELLDSLSVRSFWCWKCPRTYQWEPLKVAPVSCWYVPVSFWVTVCFLWHKRCSRPTWYFSCPRPGVSCFP